MKMETDAKPLRHLTFGDELEFSLRHHQYAPAAKCKTMNKEFCRHSDGQTQTNKQTREENMKKTLVVHPAAVTRRLWHLKNLKNFRIAKLVAARSNGFAKCRPWIEFLQFAFFALASYLPFIYGHYVPCKMRLSIVQFA
jgi:hypothetical protein